MSHTITKCDGFFEVEVSGPTSKEEILSIVFALAQRDPRKTLPDLWVLSEQSMVTFLDLTDIADAIAPHMPAEHTGSKTAFVTTSPLQESELELYISEAGALGLEMKIFHSRDEAAAWITGDVPDFY